MYLPLLTLALVGCPKQRTDAELAKERCLAREGWWFEDAVAGHCSYPEGTLQDTRAEPMPQVPESPGAADAVLKAATPDDSLEPEQIAPGTIFIVAQRTEGEDALEADAVRLIEPPVTVMAEDGEHAVLSRFVVNPVDPDDTTAALEDEGEPLELDTE